MPTDTTNQNTKTAILLFANNMEECEALITVDLLRRAKVNVITASAEDTLVVSSTRNIKIEADVLAANAKFEEADMLILPGGRGARDTFANSKLVIEQCKKFVESKRFLAAICAAPSVPGENGLLKDVDATCYPGFETNLKGANYQDKGVVDAGNIVTGRALGSSIDFSLVLIEKLCGKDTADKIKQEIYY